MNPEFWRGKRVLLTGHTGFKGSWLSLWLQTLGAELVGYALPAPTSPSLFEEAQVGQGMTSVMGDVRDLSKLQSVFDLYQPQIVIHMAAQPLVRYSYQNPVETYSTNVMGTVHLLECVRSTPGVKAVVNITTDKCYENREWVWGYRENEPLGGHDPYSNSKGCAELVSAAYRSSFFNEDKYIKHGVAVATARAGNVIGGGDWSIDRLIPDIIYALLQEKKLNIRSPNAIRPWQHVLEPLSGYLILAEKLFNEGPKFAEAWNFGPAEKDAKSVEWVATEIANAWGKKLDIHIDGGDHPHEANYLKLDISKARMHLDWQPLLSLEDSIKMIVEWVKGFEKGISARNLTHDQIRLYQVAARSKFIKRK